MTKKVSKSRRKRHSYTLEFKLEAVKLAKSKGIKQTAKDLGVCIDTLRLWIHKHNQAEGQSNEQLLKEFNRLSKENSYLRKINEVLKKTTTIFCKDAKKDLFS